MTTLLQWLVTAEQLRVKAEEIRTMAEDFKFPRIKQLMMTIADGFERQAAGIECMIGVQYHSGAEAIIQEAMHQ